MAVGARAVAAAAAAASAGSRRGVKARHEHIQDRWRVFASRNTHANAQLFRRTLGLERSVRVSV